MNSIDKIFELCRHNADMTFDKSWSQGRTVFGGVSAAAILRAMDFELESPRPLRVLHVNFIAPLKIEKPCRITIEHLRDGQNVTQLQGRLTQDNQTCVQVQACYGKSRDSKINRLSDQQCSLKSASKGNFLPIIPGVTPKFLKHITLDFQSGKLPFTGSKHSHIDGWMKFKEVPTNISLAHIVALADAWPPTVLQMLKWPKPASTLSWQVDVLQPEIKLPPSQWIGYQAKTLQATDGYSHTQANIWSESGELILLSRQTDVIFG